MDKHKPKILFVEDDANLGFVVRDNLEQQDYQVVLCADGLEGEEAFKADKFDICLLDVMLPAQDGFSLAQKIRDTDLDIPILFLTARGMKEDKIKGFSTGADDYITKPFSIEELILRIEVFLKRSGVKKRVSTKFEIGAYQFDFENFELNHTDGNNQRLTEMEAEVLQQFCKNLGQVVKRQEILNNVWGDDDYFNGRSLDVFISRLRKYLAKDKNINLSNVHGVGFRLEIK